MRLSDRGYIMLESLVAGGIVSVALATSITLVASARFETSMAARRAEASQIALATADALMSQSSAATQTATAVPGHPGLSVAFTVAAASLAGNSTPALESNNRLHQITVTVTYPTSQGTAQFVYHRLRRTVIP
jgi:hypothetical protein